MTGPLDTTPVSVGSLCSGYGGLDMGLALALGEPVRHAWHVEYDDAPSKILSHHWPEVPNYGDVKLTDWADVEPVDWLTAGYPCQPFSHAGLRKGADDPRHLWPGVARALSVLRPRHALLENVRGHVSLGLDAVLADLADLGYDATWGVVRAADAGAPHGRARIFIVAADARGERHGRREDARGVGRLDGPDEVVARERQRPRSEPVDRDAQAAADARGGPLAGAATAGNGLRLAPECGAGAAADADFTRLEGTEPAGGRLLPARCAAADSQSDGRDEGRSESARVERRLDAAECSREAVTWGDYEPAIRRWEAVTGRAAPRPTEPGRTGERLSPRFVEWMMGLPAGHVTDVPGLARNAQLKALGNGVVPQQAALAVRTLLPLAVAA